MEFSCPHHSMKSSIHPILVSPFLGLAPKFEKSFTCHLLLPSPLYTNARTLKRGHQVPTCPTEINKYLLSSSVTDTVEGTKTFVTRSLLPRAFQSSGKN